MPREGYSSITINDKLKETLTRIAKKHDESIPETIARLVEKKNCKTEA